MPHQSRSTAQRTLTAVDFEVYLLMTMLCRAAAKSAALTRLGLTLDDGRRISDAVRVHLDGSPSRFAAVAELLGLAPTAYLLHTESLRLWPDFRLLLAAGRHGTLAYATFTRAAGVSTQLPPPSALRPWSTTRDELAAAYGPLRTTDHCPPHEAYTFQHAAGTCTATFSWGLLMELDASGAES
ncbi:hypothetical protein [Nocardia stercoris]|uniref:Uncharacterized protein n=1 Tax=Nocardia stercoris TaxID=2483361 RepID=A0A3M2L369_9NOCA|nr:hypothetical protein [Nocardia stercoris]RMI30963.1 hypothetical protein EBN03_20270 [Nocardia stercoris]